MRIITVVIIFSSTLLLICWSASVENKRIFKEKSSIDFYSSRAVEYLMVAVHKWDYKNEHLALNKRTI